MSSLLKKYKWDYRNFFEDNSTVIFLNPLSTIVMPYEKQKNIKTIGYYLPEYAQKELNDITDAAEGHIIYSKYLEEKIDKIINSDSKIYIVYNKENSEIFLNSLHYYNEKKETQRTLSNCKKLNAKFLNREWVKLDATICEYN